MLGYRRLPAFLLATTLSLKQLISIPLRHLAWVSIARLIQHRDRGSQALVEYAAHRRIHELPAGSSGIPAGFIALQRRALVGVPPRSAGTVLRVPVQWAYVGLCFARVHRIVQDRAVPAARRQVVGCV